MKPVEFPECNVTFAEDQPEYLPLPTFTDGTQTVSCWKMTWWERIKVLITGKIWLMQMNFGQPLQPQLPCVDKPLENRVGDHADDCLDESLGTYRPDQNERSPEPLNFSSTVSKNIAARLAAEQIAELADEEAERHGRRFWEQLAKIVNAHVPFPGSVRRKRDGMSDVEAKTFGNQLMLFGEYLGR